MADGFICRCPQHLQGALCEEMSAYGRASSTADEQCVCHDQEGHTTCECTLDSATESNVISAGDCWPSVNLTALAVTVACKHHVKDKDTCESYDFITLTNQTVIASDDEVRSTNCLQLTFHQELCGVGFLQNSFEVKRVRMAMQSPVTDSLNNITKQVHCFSGSQKSVGSIMTSVQIIDPMVSDS